MSFVTSCAMVQTKHVSLSARLQLCLLWIASILITYFLTAQSQACSPTPESFVNPYSAKRLATEDTNSVSLERNATKGYLSLKKLYRSSSRDSSLPTSRAAKRGHQNFSGSEDSLSVKAAPSSSNHTPSYHAWLPTLAYDPELPPYLPVFMAFQFNYELLQQTLMSYKLAQVHNIIVLDNSLGKHAIQDVANLKSKYGVAQVIEMPFSLFFTELQNLMAFIARQTQLPLYYWSHMDVIALPHSDRPEDAMGLRMGQCAEQAFSNDATWGVLYNSNDNLCANRLEAFDACGGYDTYVTTYSADCDFYARMRDKGYITLDCDVGYIFDATINNASVTEAMNAPYEQVSWQQKHDLMRDMAWRKQHSRGAWREADFTDADKAAWWPLSQMGQQYYNKKFNGKECGAPAEGNMQFDRAAVPMATVQNKNQELLDKYKQLYAGVKSIL